MDLSKCDVLIQSGEGDLGRFMRYYGPHTRKALQSRLTRERAQGDRWAMLWVSDQTPDANGERVYVQWNADGFGSPSARILSERDIRSVTAHTTTPNRK
jgi:hypothetical protein